MSEQFENSIRKKLQDAEVPFDPAAWEQMKKRLDDSDRRRPVLFWWILSGLLILVAAGGFWWWSSAQNFPLTEHRISVTDSLQKNSSQATPVHTLEPDNHAAPSTDSPLFVDKNPGSEQNITDAPVNHSNRRQSTNNGSSTNIYIPSKNDQQKSNNRSGMITPPPVSENDPVDDRKNVPSTVITSKENTGDNKTENPQSGSNIVAPDNKTVDIQPVDNNKEKRSITDSTSSISENENLQQDSITPKKQQRSGFEGGITLGADYNVAASMKRGKIGTSLGVILKYHFNNRWSVQTGAIYTKKVYGANATEYHFTYPVSYKWVAANCDVLDVPLNVHYTFSASANTRWSAVVGASSYFMLKEKYDYWWGNGTKNTHQYKNENQHYFSVLNLGVNWERQTMGRLKWSLQPYVKVPLGGVGQGKISLYSAGLALQLTMGKK